MVDEYGKRALEMTRVHDQQPVETLRSDSANEPFGDPIRFRYLSRRAKDSGALGLKHSVKAAREFAIVIAKQKANGLRALSQGPRHLPRLLGDPVPVGMGRAASQVHTAAGDFDEEQHVQPLEPDCVDSEERRGDHALRVRAEEITPRWPRAQVRDRAVPRAGSSEPWSLTRQCPVLSVRQRYADGPSGDSRVPTALPALEPHRQSVGDHAAARRSSDSRPVVCAIVEASM